MHAADQATLEARKDFEGHASASGQLRANEPQGQHEWRYVQGMPYTTNAALLARQCLLASGCTAQANGTVFLPACRRSMPTAPLT